MSETAAPAQPLVLNIQYTKDLSFEVPGAPQIYTQLRSQPQVGINLDVQARRIQEGQQPHDRGQGVGRGVGQEIAGVFGLV